MRQSLTGLLVVATIVGPADGGPSARNHRIPEGRITELMTVDDAADRAIAFIDAVSGGDAPDPDDNAIRGWHLDGMTWFWYGTPAVSETEDARFGFYDDLAQAADHAAYDDPYDIVSVPAGNDRGESHDGGHFVRSGADWAWSNEPRGADGGAAGYDSIGQVASAKNVLAIGDPNGTKRTGVKGGGGVKGGFTGWGPTDDGRIKPDIVANGKALFAPGGSGSNGNGGLLLQHYSSTHGGADMRSATFKGLVVHTADEAGDYYGPDYRSGWGKLSVSAAQQHITLDTADPDVIQELQLADGGFIEQAWSADGNTPIKATICWTDPAGTPPALTLDPTTPMLVNDLDLRIIGPGNTVHEPWILDPADPDAPATRGDNARDNVEVVMIPVTVAGVYRLEVSHKGSLVNGVQDFALVLGRVDAGPQCGPDEILDCNGNCAPAAWLNDGVCDDGARMHNGNVIDFSCVELDDGDDCLVVVEDPPPFIVWRNTVTNSHAIWFMDGVTLLPETGYLPGMPSADWRVVGAGDFDGDGRADLLRRDATTGQNRIWFMADTSLMPEDQPTTSAAPGWAVVAVGDFDTDGKADILWRNTDGRNAVWFMDGAALRPETDFLPPIALGWQVVGSGDFDGDGFRDILWRHAVTAENAIWFMAGTSLTFDVELPLAVPLAWQVRGTEDFDGDGKTDILWRNVVNNQNALWFMDGAALRPETGLLPTVAALWVVAAVTDLDNDGNQEILWRSTVTGDNFAWFLQGTSLEPTGAYSTPAGLVWDVVATGR